MKKIWRVLRERWRILRSRCKECGGKIKGGFESFEGAPKNTCYVCWFENELNPIRDGWFRVVQRIPWGDLMEADGNARLRKRTNH